MFRKIFLLLFLILLPSFFVNSSENSILINEIAWMGTDISSTDEWIELFNSTGSDIVLDGWSLKSRDGQPEILLKGIIPAQGYFLLERTDDYAVPNKIANQIYTGSLSNTGEYLELFDKENILVDFVVADTSWEYGDNNTKQTMERKNDFLWQNSFFPLGTPASKNSSIQVEGENTEVVSTTTEENILSSQYRYADVLINEIVSDPGDGEVEWVELYNNSGQVIDLDSWYIKDGSKTKTTLKGELENKAFYVIEKPNGNLNNNGDEILLFSPNNKLINVLAYGEWDDGNIADNAPLAIDPFSLARTKNIDTRNNANDFAVSVRKTKGEENIVLRDSQFSEDDTLEYDFGRTIVLSEIFPNPVGDDKEGEFIELYNYGERDINLFGWRLGDASTKRFEFGVGDKIEAKKYLVIYRTDSGIALNNTGDELNIYQAGSEDAFYSLQYKKAQEGFSFNNTQTEETANFYNKDFNATSWLWAETISPGRKNIFELVNHSPEVDFSFSEELFVARPVLFDSSDSFDSDEDELSYHWDFGDGFENILANPEHTFFQAGIYNVVLEISDGENKVQKEKVVEVKDNYSFSYKDDKGEGLDFGNTKIFITEILPNPDGDDNEGEFVEIYNAGEKPLDLLNWVLDDMEGGSKPYKIESDTIINPKEYFVLNRTESSLILNNSYDKVRLISPDEKVVDEVEYKKTFNAQSYSRDEKGSWVWTKNLSPGSQNKNEVVCQENKIENSFSRAVYYSPKSPREAQSHGAGQMVLLEGVVNSLPGMFSSQYFYIDGDGGVQIYSSKKDFPELEIGDLIQVRGEISKINNESRIKIKEASQIAVLDDGYTLTPQKNEGKFDIENIGKLQKISGEVTDKKNNKFVLATSEGGIDVEIKKGTKIDLKKIKNGEKINLLGVLVTDKDGFLVLPRMESDIEKIEIKREKKEGQVLGEYSEDEQWTLEQKNNNKKYYYLLLYFFAVLFLIFIYKKTRR